MEAIEKKRVDIVIECYEYWNIGGDERVTELIEKFKSNIAIGNIEVSIKLLFSLKDILKNFDMSVMPVELAISELEKVNQADFELTKTQYELF